jgi:hypothetical protein
MTSIPQGSFVPGLELSRGFFAAAVEPLLDRGFPGLAYTAALIGTGSEVLGFDTAMSTDHHWGPRVMLFLRPEDVQARREDIRVYLGLKLPPSYRGYSTHFSPPNPNDKGVQHLAPYSGGPINHRVEILTIDGFFRSYLNLCLAEPMTPADWLSLPSQKLRSIVSGAVFHDDLALGAIRERLSWYPEDVGLYLLGCLWARLGQEEHLMGRAGHVGDELGSALIAARLVRDIMRIAFCLERQYPPYPKWFGTAFGKLICAPRLRPHLEAVLQSRTWQEREAALCPAFETLVQIQRAAGIADDLPGRVSDFWGRPFLVIHGEMMANTIFARIAEGRLSALVRRRPIGSIDLISDSTDVLEDTSMRPRLRDLYEP